MKKQIISILKIIIPIFIGLYICWYFWSGFSEEDKENFFNVFKDANYGILAVSLLIGFGSHLARAIRWRYMLRTLGHEVSTYNSYNAIMIGYIANIVVPRMGEASRAGVLKQTDNISFEKSFGTIVAERVIDVVCLGTITGIALLMNLDNIDDLKALGEQLNANKAAHSDEGVPILKYVIYGIILLGILAVFFLYKTNEKFRTKVKTFLTGFWEGIKTIFTMKEKWAYLAYTVAIWTSYVLMFWITFYAWDGAKDMPLDGIFAAFISGTIGFIIVQGGIGTYPIMVGMVLTFFLEPSYLADASTSGPLPEHTGFGWLVWSTQTVLIVVLGLLSLFLVRKNKNKLRVEA